MTIEQGLRDWYRRAGGWFLDRPACAVLLLGTIQAMLLTRIMGGDRWALVLGVAIGYPWAFGTIWWARRKRNLATAQRPRFSD